MYSEGLLELRTSEATAFCKPLLQPAQRPLALHSMALLAIADSWLQRRKQIESDICRLEVLRVGLGDVVD